MGIRRKKTLVEQAVDYVEQAVEQARPHVEQAVEAARERAVPLLQDARDKAGPAIADARDKAKPVIADGAALAAAKAAVVAEAASQKASEGRDLASAKVAELKGEPPKKKHRVRKFLVFSGLAAGGGLCRRQAQEPPGGPELAVVLHPDPAAGPAGAEGRDGRRRLRPAPKAAPAPPPTAEEAASDDVAGSSPDEALADATDTPHAATTPDHPVEEVVVDEDAKSKK